LRSYRNPFRARASEQLSEPIAFLRNFGAGMLEALPDADSIWDLPLVLRSAPGGGKTSLLRLFAIESLLLVESRRSEFPELVEQLERLEALRGEGASHLGVSLNLSHDYRSLLDLQLPREQLVRAFFSLLDARIILAVVRAALTAGGAEDPAELDLIALGSQAEAEAEASVLGGLGGAGLFEHAVQTEREILRPLDGLLPGEVDLREHTAAPRLHSLALLSRTRLQVAGRELPQRPLVMFDDGHELGPEQRRELLDALQDRSLGVARWYAERYEALSNEEVLVGSAEGRDFEIVELESMARKRGRNYERALLDIANRRARPYLDDYAGSQQTFTDLIDSSPEELLGGRAEELLDSMRLRIAALAGERQRYAKWIAETGRPTYEGLVDLRALEIVISADLERAQVELLDLPLESKDLQARQQRVRASARHFLARDFGLPYFVGPRVMARLGSENVDQFLRLAGDVFEEMLAKVTLRRMPRIGAAEQDRIVHALSERYWRELPARVQSGRLVQTLLEAIIKICQAETFRATAPYAPGVTGVAMPMPDRERLLDQAGREGIRGAEELFRALGSGIAANVFSVQLDYSVKNQRVMVIYLNRLLCPRFDLPLGRGGFRERRLEQMAAWMHGSPVRGGEPETRGQAQLQI
jgi:hypothetical protein